MTVIAMTREMGSLGKDVAKGVADRLGLDLVYHEIVDGIADQMRTTSTAVCRYLDGSAGLLNRVRGKKQALVAFTREQVVELALRGDVIIRGWGATCILAPCSHVVRVRVRAPLELRIERMVERIDAWNRDAAKEEIRRSDNTHHKILSGLCGLTDWENECHYHKVFDTGQESVEDCIEGLIDLVSEPRFQQTAASHARLTQMLRENRAMTEVFNNNMAAAEFRVGPP